MKLRSSAWWCAAAFGVLFVLGAGAPALAADVTGTWKWSTDRNGTIVETTLKLKQDGEKLTGTMSGRNNTENEIEDGKVTGDTVSFKVTREFNGNKVVTAYEGKVTGDTIKGERKSERDGQVQAREWEAKRDK